MSKQTNPLKNRSLVFLIGIIVYLSIEPPINSMQPKKSIKKITNLFMKTAEKNPLCTAVVEDIGTIATAVAIEKLLAMNNVPPAMSLPISFGIFLGIKAFSIQSKTKSDPEYFDRLFNIYEQEIMDIPVLGPLGILLSFPLILTQAAAANNN